MNTEILGVILQLVCLVGLSYPLGRYIAKVYKGEKTWSDFMAPIERWIYKFSGINPEEEMNWKQFLKALLIVNLFWFFWGMILLVSQGILPLNPDGNPGQSPDLAFNTCISFMVNCNLQHYSGETGLSYFTQLFVINSSRQPAAWRHWPASLRPWPLKRPRRSATSGFTWSKARPVS